MRAAADFPMPPVEPVAALSQPLDLGFEARDLRLDPVEHGAGRRIRAERCNCNLPGHRISRFAAGFDNVKICDTHIKIKSVSYSLRAYSHAFNMRSAQSLEAYILPMDVAEEIKAWRRDLGWTQAQAAEALGVPVQTVRAWEINRYPPRHRRVLTLALAQITAEQQRVRRKRQ